MDIINWFAQKCPHIYEFREMFFKAIWVTLGVTVVSILGGTIIGVCGALARIMRFEKGGFLFKSIAWIFRQISLLYITIFRGTPLFVQIFVWYFVWFGVFVDVKEGLLVSGDAAQNLRSNYGAIIAGILALTFNSGAYITEIFRAGIQSLDKGQTEGAYSLGLTYWQTMRFILMPQAFRRMLPALGNEFITLLKDSSLLAIIAVPELLYVARTIAGNYTEYKEPYYTVALIYLFMTVIFSWILSLFEKKLNKKQQH